MGISDWSSDVCSSDLGRRREDERVIGADRDTHAGIEEARKRMILEGRDGAGHPVARRRDPQRRRFLYEASEEMRGFHCSDSVIEERKSLVSGKTVSVRVDLRSGRHIQKKIRRK